MPTLNWIGKEAVVNHDKEVPFRLLKKVKAHSVGENSQNLIIHGDNLEALKALMPYYQGKIKCIYIDPPYNTGNEGWVYNDKVNSPKIKKWLGKVVGGDSEDLCRHDKWLCMMCPRLKLLRELLCDGGVIFISIDDNEHCNLKKIMDEIFGEDNFINTILISRNTSEQTEYRHSLNEEKEFVVVYSKNTNFQFSKVGVPFDKTGLELLNLIKNKGLDSKYQSYFEELFDLRSMKNEWKSLYTGKEVRPSMQYDILGVKPFTKENPIRRWMWGKDRTLQAVENYKQFLKEYPDGKDEQLQNYIEKTGIRDFVRKSKTNIIQYYKHGKEERLIGDNWMDIRTSSGANDIKFLFKQKIFDNPKPLNLIKRIIEIATEKEDIILDSFAGSGTTGEAVLDLNNQDGGNRRFILIQIEEKMKEPIKLEKGVVLNDIIEITRERIKRAINIKGYKEGFEYCELDKPLFNEEGQIEEECSFEQLATYIYFTETNTNLDKKQISDKLIGTYNDMEYYLLFKEKGKNILNKDFLNKISRGGKKKVIYADKCLIDEKTMVRYNIQFKQIPYEVKVY